MTLERPLSAVEVERRAYRRRRSQRSVLLAALSTLVVAAVVVGVLALTPGTAVVARTFFDPAEAVRVLPAVLAGLWVNVVVLVFAAIGVAVVATLLAVLRTLRGPVFAPLRFLAAVYTDVFRGVPVIVMILLIGFGVPGLNPSVLYDSRLLGGLALVLTYSAYVAEVLRAGIESVHPSQRLAARSLGLTHGQTLRLVVLPQGVRRVTPALVNDFVSMQKDVGLISILGAVDAVRAAQIQVAVNYNYTAYVVAGLLFVLLSLPFIRLTDVLERRARIRQQQGGVL
ncbi:amino acid ABC transporter permease [Amnibacterium setariae]|uniref:Amino acid ABC transporter permease n=1 Tax=Amnibacterium setariae TaxID=2306585 RepID=A0A3A1U8S8_9MICO|nr:amino acid ABC transporter permease [Amnibacterium setariae]RIX30649.1 amino acid ABC transporter permease [Amnibacterium setariae]